MDTLIPIGSVVPLFTLPDLKGNLHRLGDERGRWVLLNFWSAECPWCRYADEQVAQILAPWEGIVWWSLAVNANEPPDLLAREAERRGLPLVLHDAQRKVADLYGAQTTPHFFLVDPQGVLRYRGALDDATFRQRQPTRFYLRQALEALMSGRNPEIAETPPYGCAIVRYASL